MRKITSGIYFLYQDDELVYIGKSENVFYRIGTHIQENKKEFNSWSLYETEEPELSRLETFLINIYKPKYNEQIWEDHNLTYIGDYNTLSQDLMKRIAAYETFYEYVDVKWLINLFDADREIIKELIDYDIPEKMVKEINGYILVKRYYVIENYFAIDRKIHKIKTRKMEYKEIATQKVEELLNGRKKNE